MKKTKGFTLIEVFIVIAIISLLLSIAIPNIAFARFRAKANIKDDVYANAVWKEAKKDTKEALRLVAINWTPPTETPAVVKQVQPVVRTVVQPVVQPVTAPVLFSGLPNSDSVNSNILVCPKCKFIFGKYKLTENN